MRSAGHTSRTAPLTERLSRSGPRWPASNGLAPRSMSAPPRPRLRRFRRARRRAHDRRHVRADGTFVFTDIVDSTKFAELLGDSAWHDLLRWHDQTIRAIAAEHGGEDVKTVGDGFFLAFETVDEAIQAAVAIQRRFAEQRRDHGSAPAVRIGLHPGRRGPCRPRLHRNRRQRGRARGRSGGRRRDPHVVDQRRGRAKRSRRLASPRARPSRRVPQATLPDAHR